jgi:hypothetical protein
LHGLFAINTYSFLSPGASLRPVLEETVTFCGLVQRKAERERARVRKKHRGEKNNRKRRTRPDVLTNEEKEAE